MAVEEIADLDDPRLADYTHLREPSRRMHLERERGIFTVEGRLSIEVLLDSSYAVRSLLVATEHVQRVSSMLHTDVPIFSLPAAEMETVTGVHFHRGVLAVAERPDLPSVQELVADARRVLLLEAVNDHENIGALFRNAAAFGVDAVVLDPMTADPLYRRSTRVSLGHVLTVPFARVEPGGWPGALDGLRRVGLVTVALTPSGDAEPLGRLVADPPERVALLLGAEGQGLTDAALSAVDRRVRIPMASGVDSVNVATASAIALSALYGWDGP
ncbi:MAG: RNA methyltransferase [Acidimicrobiales bacterium]|nr:RNA methyltransferase [Acidimicrobiales bacterium]